MKLLLIGICIIWPLFDTGASTPTVENVESVNYRLSTDIIPSDYIVEVTPHFTNKSGKEPFTFDGCVKIILQATRDDVNTIVLHMEDLNITEHILTTKTKSYFDWTIQQFAIQHTEYDKKTNKYSIILSDSLEKNKDHELMLRFNGKLRDDAVGFYRMSYEDGNVTK